MSTRMLKPVIIFCIMALIVGVVSITNVHAEWYMSKVVQVIPRASGNTFVQFTSAANPQEWNGVARGLIVGDDEGSKALLATFLTALSLGYNISIEMNQVPSFNNIGVITGAGVAAP